MTVITSSTSASDYCIKTSQGGWFAYKHGPDGAISTGKTPDDANCQATP